MCHWEGERGIESVGNERGPGVEVGNESAPVVGVQHVTVTTGASGHGRTLLRVL